ncbi:hypothetical protein EST38_g6551 [Candolleomyces aberdarensis]|uniref:HAT C-terminal dimerisation domain-containing protein n=1 Tax=Candolleomyces aberdarensis TaxID=2316362 RepID=A0A4Q2DJD5_9AGAR|nr:hypothetical protein EST38_g6551 [Candolleomyces aberdarensis]
MANSDDQCTLGPDGRLLPASQITFYNDPDDPTPLPPVVDMDMSPAQDASSRSHPQRSNAGSQMHQLICDKKLDDNNQLCLKFRDTQCTSKAARRPKVKASTVIDLSEGEDEDKEDDDKEIENNELADILPVKTNPKDMVEHLRSSFPTMYNLYLGLKEQKSPASDMEAAVASGSADSDKPSVQELLQSLKNCTQTIEQAFEQQTRNTWDQASFERLLVEWIATCNQPFDEVEKPEFRCLLEYIHSPSHKALNIPHRSTIRCRLMKMGKDAVQKELLIDFCEIQRTNTGENLAEHVWNMLEMYNLLSKVIAFVMDNATNNNTLADAFECRCQAAQILFSATDAQLQCMPHIIHLAALQLLKGIGAIDPAKLRTASPYQQDVAASLFADASDEKLEGGDASSDLHLDETVPMDSSAMAETPEACPNSITKLTWIEKSATHQMSATRTSMLSSTIAVFHGLQQQLKERIRKLPSNFSPEVCTALVNSHKKLSDHYFCFDTSPYGTWAALLDPHISYEGLKNAFPNDADLTTDLETAKSKLEQHYRVHYERSTPVSHHTDTASSAPSSSVFDFTSTFRRAPRAVQNELQSYFQMPPKDFTTCDPVRWWYTHRLQFPNLYKLALDILSIPG